MNLLAMGVSHKTAPLSLRERMQFTSHRCAELLTALVRQPGLSEAVALSTCNRTELYLAAADPAAAEQVARTALAHAAGLSERDLVGVVRPVRGSEAARHLFRVTAGLESMIPGEAEIQGQVRRAYEQALALGTSGPLTNRLLQDALRTGKRVRSETGLGRGGGSVAAVAVELARAELGELSGRRALVIGAGKHGALAARALRAGGVQAVFVANRSEEVAEELARRCGGRAVRFHALAEELGRADLVIACTASPRRVISAADLAAATAARRIVVVDTAVPRDVDPAAARLPGVALFDMDDVQRAAAANLAARTTEAARAEPILDDEVARFRRWLASLDVVPTIAALRTRGIAAAERALRQNEGRWRSLTDDDRDRMRVMAQAVVSDLLHQPTVSLRRAGERGSSSAYLEIVRELFGLSA